LHLQVGENFKL